MRMRIKLLASLSSIAMLIGIPTSAQHLLGVFSGAVLQLDTQIESPAQNNNAQTLPEQQAGDTIQFQLFAPDGGGRSTNGFTVELDMPGRTFSSYIGDMSGTDWNGAALVIRGQQLSALFITGATVPSSGYLGQVDLRVSQALEAGATLAVKSLSMTSGREVDQLNVSKAKISFTAVSACPGDFDNSGSVDLADFLAFAGAFGTSSSDANYDARSDLDGSGSVDLADFLLFAGVFGTTCPTDPEPPPKTPPPDGSIATWNLPQHAVARLGKGTLSGRSYAIAYSPDGSRLAVGSHVGIWLYDAGNWEEQALLSGHTGQVISVAFSPDGTKVASGSSDRTVRVWDLEARTEIAQLQGHTDNVTTVAYSPDGSTIASGSADGTVRLWDVAAKTQIISHDPGLGYIYAVAFSPDGTKVASSHSGGGVVRLWDVASHRLITERPHGTAASVAFSPDGSIIGLSRTEGSLGTADFSLWNYARDNYGAYWDDASSGTYSLAFSPDGSTFAVGPTQINYTVDIWRMQPDLSSVTSVSSLEGHTGAVTSLAFSRDGSKLAAVDSWNTVRVWDLQTETQTTVSKFPDTVYSIAVSPDGSTIASGVYGSTSPAAPKDKTVRLWDTATHTEIAQLQGHSEIVFSVAFSPDGSRIASGSKDGTVRLWDTTTQSETAQLRGHTETVFSVAFSPNGSTVASGSEDGTVRLWDTTTRSETAQLRGHTETVFSVAFSPNGSTVASGSEDGTVRLWDTTTRSETAQLRGHTETVFSVAFSPNGSTVASGSEDGTVRLWDATTQRETAQLQGHSGTVHSVSYSPDGSKIVSGGMDETVRLWDVASQRLIETRHGHTNEVSSVAFLPDGSRIASGSADGTILIWESGSPSQPPGGNGANTRPVARAGEDQSVDKRETVTLDGSNSSDPEGQPLNFTWRQIEGIQVILSNPKIARPTIDTLEPDNYVFELVVHDGTIASVPDTVVVEIVSIADAAVKVGGPDAAFMHKTTTGDQVTFTVRGTAPPVQVGEVMVNTVEPYFLKKVTRLVSQNENEVVIETEDAALTDVIEDATIRRSFRIPAAKLALSSPPATGEITLHSDDTARLSLTSYDISLPREYWLEADIKIFSLKSLEVAVTGDLIATLGMDLAAYSSFSVNADKTVGQLPPFTFKTFVGWIPVTVTIQGKLSVGVDYNATAAGRITAGITISKPVAIGVEYEDGSWQELTGGSPATHDVHEPTLDLQGSVSVRGYVRGQLDVEILQVGGPYFGVRSYLSFDAVKNQSSKQIDWQLHTGIDGYSGVKTTIFGKIGIWDFDVDKSWNFNLYMALLKDGIIPLAEVISFDLHSGTVLSHGITYSNNRFYVGAWVESRSWLHAYTESGQRDWSSDIYLRRGRVLAPEIIVPSGLTYGNKRLYMVFPGHSGAAGYLGYTESLEERDGSLTELNSDNDAPTGLTFANNRLYVVDGHDAKVYGYTSSGQPDSDADFDLDSNNDSPTGITFANSRFYVVDGNDVNVYGYTSSGQRDSEVDFDLDSNNDSPTGITFANNRFYVVDAHNRKIYGYASPDPKNSTDSFQSTRSLP